MDTAGEAWQALDSEPVWTRFEERYRFHPEYGTQVRPAITEPPESVTFSLRPIFDPEGAAFAVGEASLDTLVHRSLVELLPPDAPMVVLDWQHPSYRFWPGREVRSSSDWPLAPFPNGDYHAFLTEDLATGTFGHPWEPSLCVLGPSLVALLAPRLASWLPILRDARTAA